MMTTQMQLKLKQSLISHEGCKRFPYCDTVNKITIGIGYNLTARGLPDDVINTLYNQDVQYFYCQLSEFEWFRKLNEDRQLVLLDMSFMGIKKLLGFEELIKAIIREDWEAAEKEILNSKWTEDVGEKRSTECANGMRTGIFLVK